MIDPQISEALLVEGVANFLTGGQKNASEDAWRWLKTCTKWQLAAWKHGSKPFWDPILGFSVHHPS